MKFITVNTNIMLQQALAIRKIVFVDEQHVPLSEEIDINENECTHFLVYNDNNEPIATCRTKHFDDNTIKIQRVCILKSYRKMNIGKQLMEFAELSAKNNGFTKARLDAQVTAINFYQKLGYRVISSVFLDANIEHQTMEKLL